VEGGIVTIGGAERMVFAALGLFRDRGSEVHCIVNDWENEAVAAEAERVGATWSPGSYQRRLRWRNQNPMETVRGAVATMATGADLLKQASRFRPSVIFFSDFETILRNLAALAILKAKGTPVILYLHNSPPHQRPYPALFRRAIDPLVTRYATISRNMENELNAFGIRRSKFSYVNNFVPENPGASETDRRVFKKVVFAGQMIPQKGLDIVLDAFAKVAAEDSEAHLDIAAKIDGWISPRYQGFRAKVLARAGQPDLTGRVTFLGWHSDVPGLLARAGVHCSMSRPEMHEGMPLVCLEAKAAATPSVVPSYGPFKELVTHGIDGWLCDDMSTESVALGLKFFLDDPVRARKAGNAAFESSRKFSQDEFGRGWDSFFANMDRKWR
jgi:glycosyltransferase involved in cell wall biosynthesis